MATALAKSRQIKLLLVGDKETGKHCFIRRLIEDRYPRDKWSNVSFTILTQLIHRLGLL